MKRNLAVIILLGLFFILSSENLVIESFTSSSMANANDLIEYNEKYWIATDNGVLMLDAVPGSPMCSLREFNEDNGLLNNNVSHFATFQNKMWVGTQRGINIFDDVNITTSTVTCSDGLCCDSVTAVASIDNAVWVGSCNGVTIINLIPGIPVRSSYTYDTLTVSSGLTCNEIQAMAVGRLFNKNTGFIGTKNGLNYSYRDMGDYVCKTITSDDGLTSCNIRDIKVCGNNIWLATDAGISIVKFSNDFDTYTIARYTVLDGLPSNDVRSIDAGINSTYWAGTDNGLVKIKFASVPVRSERTPIFRIYTTNDGLLGNDIGAIRYIDQKVFVTSDGGFNVLNFNPIANDDNVNPVKETVGIENYPNPFNPETEIRYTVPTSGITKITIFNIKGQVVKELVNEYKPSGTHTIKWNGKNTSNSSVSSGLYFCRIVHADGTDLTKMSLLK